MPESEEIPFEQRDDADTATASGRLSGGIYFVATPIGAARDITLRALDILRDADVLVAEDTRTLRHLMEIHGVPLAGRKVIAYHDHNGERSRPGLLKLLERGLSLAYASEAGTPLVADPGFQLGRAAIAAGFPVISAPGPSAVLAALTVSGLPSDRFLFAGFPPSQGAARKTWLSGMANIPATLIFYESPKRVGKFLIELVECLGDERKAAVCRELTKRYEEISRGTLKELSVDFGGREVRGEIVVVVDRRQEQIADRAMIESAIRNAREQLSLRDASSEVADRLGLSKREVYQIALELEGKPR